MPNVLRHLALLLTLTFVLVSCSERVGSEKGARIITLGDSLLASNVGEKRSVSNMLEAELGVPVLDRSVVGAQMHYMLPISGALGMSIPKQFVPGPWEWVILNGGGNDLWLGCGCLLCTGTMERLISADGKKGEIPKLVRRIRATNARVIYVGYLRSPGFGSPIDHCKSLGDRMEARIAQMASADEGVTFLSLEDLVPYGDKSYHSADRIHPSVKGSAAVGRRVADIIRKGGL
ncbi:MULTISPECIES: SGNH/GDSL hydrolase family protein [unclassified Sulfitobacter]|jgi:acyl-CoA thioesterase-1|uniref:SGNH/GDSL hydrolase family protein n=1 Tax=unclassified Sulfitobacter TaxID=196795 RepID=UPI0007C3E79B|nr:MULTISPECIES: SGNH/GDSL hydrolase family protein [unclassified Sulfitobacter]KZY03972.1 GDSL family lipase [Sulfitobacter sp. HI0023]KZY26194.1 GDSL family lipase [Sulfitobacter sp. HI0040]KZZ70223.1 GDSL family lipase [Sulfitobacter sp. HI0129]